jgi:hypothetical protein
MYDPATLFWRHERLHRAVLRDYPGLSALGRSERDALEAKFIREALSCPPDGRGAMTSACFAEADGFERRLTEEVLARAPRRYPGRLYGAAWRSFDRRAGRPRP